MAMGKVAASAFTQFVTTSGPSRYSVVLNHVAMDARRFLDPYQRIRNAMVAGIRNGQPTATVWAAVTNAPSTMRRSWVSVAEGFEQVAPSFATASALTRRTGVWHTRKLDVNVTPHLRLAYPDGRKELVWAHVKAEEPDQLFVEIVLWLLGRIADQVLPGAAPVYADIRRGKLIRAGRSVASISGEWLASEAAGYAELRDQVSAAAA